MNIVKQYFIDKGYHVSESRFGTLYVSNHKCVVRVSDHDTGKSHELGCGSDFKADYRYEMYSNMTDLIADIESFLTSYIVPPPINPFKIEDKVRHKSSGEICEVIGIGKKEIYNYRTGRTISTDTAITIKWKDFVADYTLQDVKDLFTTNV